MELSQVSFLCNGVLLHIQVAHCACIRMYGTHVMYQH